VAGSILLWAKIPESEWTSGNQFNGLTLRDNADNYVDFIKRNLLGYVQWDYKTGGTLNQFKPNGQDDTGWVCWILTWDVSADEAKLYKNGVQIEDTETGLGTWAGPLLNGYTNIGAYINDATNGWIGSICNVAIFDKVLSEGEIAVCTQPLEESSPYALLLTFDDAHDDHYSEVFTYMESKGLHKATAFVPYAYMDAGGYLTTAQAQEMYAAGWDIANHTASAATWAGDSQAQMETSLATCKSYLDTNGMSRASNQVAYPYGYYDANSDAAMAAQGMLIGRLAGDYPEDQAFDYDDPPNILRVQARNTASIPVNTLKTYLNDAVINNRVMILYFHGVNDTGGYPTADFEELIDWIVEKNYTLMTISELYNALYS
jgi:peptidoglycan/xylan/chitin deacetylase (PgdA/CDA1 family)